MESLLEPTADSAWVLTAEGFDPLREAIYELRFSISNGFLGLRAGRAVSRGERWVVPHRAYVAGLFDLPGPENPIPALVPAPGWQQIRIMLPGGPLVHHPAEAISHRTTLDMKRGLLLTGCRLVDHPTIAVRVKTLDLVSLSERGIAVQIVELKIEDGEIEVAVEASFEGLGLGLKSGRIEQDLGVWRTKYSGKRVAMAAVSSLQIDGSEVAPIIPGPFKWSWHWKTRAGQIVCVSRLIAVTRGDAQDTDPGRIAWEKLGVARQLGWREIVESTRRLGRIGGVPAISRSKATRPLSRRCVSLSTISTVPPIPPMSAFPSEHVNSPATTITGMSSGIRKSICCRSTPLLGRKQLARCSCIASAPSMARDRKRPHGMARCHVCLGVGGYWCGGDTGAGRWSGRADHRCPLREAGAAHYRRRRVRGLAVLAGNRGCRLPPQRGGRDSPRDGSVLVEPCPGGG